MSFEVGVLNILSNFSVKGVWTKAISFICWDCRCSCWLLLLPISSVFVVFAKVEYNVFK